MKEFIGLRWVAAACLAALCAVAFASDRTEPNAFLNTTANTVPQLIQEVKTDKRVCDRYERHFGKTKEALIQYFGTLHLAKLNADGVYRIYSVDDEGVIKAHPQRLTAGTRVFADPAGMPVLKASCGNAMISGSNEGLARVDPPIGETTDSLHPVALTTPVSAEAKMMEGIALTPESPIALAPIMPPTGSRDQGIAVLPLLLGLGGAGAIAIGSGGNPPTVPEPAVVIVMASALIGMKLRRRSK